MNASKFSDAQKAFVVKQEAVRTALTSGLPRGRIAADLGIGKCTLGKRGRHAKKD